MTWALTKQTVIVVMWGELDISGLEKARSALALVDDLDARTLSVDLRALAFIDATGIGVLTEAWSRCEKAGVLSRLILRPGPVARTLHMVGIPEGVQLVEGLADRELLERVYSPV